MSYLLGYQAGRGIAKQVELRCSEMDCYTLLQLLWVVIPLQLHSYSCKFPLGQKNPCVTSMALSHWLITICLSPTLMGFQLFGEKLLHWKVLPVSRSPRCDILWCTINLWLRCSSLSLSLHRLPRTYWIGCGSLAILCLKVTEGSFCCDPEYDLTRGSWNNLPHCSWGGTTIGPPMQRHPRLDLLPPQRSLLAFCNCFWRRRKSLMVGDVLRALPSFPGEAARHGLTPTVPLLFAGNTEVRQKDDRLVSGETTRYLEPAMIMIIIKGQFPEKICIVSIYHHTE